MSGYKCYSNMPLNARKHVIESFNTPYATRPACYTTTVHFSRLLSSHQTSSTVSNDNPAKYPQKLCYIFLYKFYNHFEKLNSNAIQCSQTCKIHHKSCSNIKSLGYISQYYIIIHIIYKHTYHQN